MRISRRRWIGTVAAATGGLLVPRLGRGAVAAGRERLLADFGWRFHPGHADDPAKDFGFGRSGSAFAKSGSLLSGRGTIAQAAFDASAWTAVDLPHDWAVDLPFVNDPVLLDRGCKPLGRGYPETSIGWYRRTFDIPGSDAGRRISLDFEGVFRDATVILNNHFIGRNLSGYAPCRYDVTDVVNYGAPNTLLVRVDATEGEGWFYEGAGIYRHVWLEKTAPVHVAPEGVFVWTELGDRTARVHVDVEIVNESDQDAFCTLNSSLLNPPAGSVAGAVSGQRVQAGAAARLQLQLDVREPQVWSIEQPHLYTLETALTTAASEDRVRTTVGMRSVRFDADEGFFLNGRRVEIKGMCNHQDHAGVGSALPDRVQGYRIERLKAMGVNAYRTSHNPPTPALLDACDRLGMLVLDETRMMASTDEGLSQLTRLVRRDRNHPSVFCWSIGNEEPDQGSERGARVAATMKRVVQELDPTRLVTEAMNNGWGRGLTAVVDVQGFNYGHAKEIDDFRRTFPTHLAMGTEVASTVSTRGVYANDPEKGYVSAYDRNFPPWASTAEEWWTTYAARPWIAGGFVWTGFDYRGEPTPYKWPCINSHFGILDTCGFPKDLFYYYRAWWSGEDTLHLFPHWNWAGKEGQDIEVWCFTNLERVELLVNGTSVGAQDVARNAHVSWKVPYAAGAIEARGFRANRQILVDRRETTGPAAAIVLTPDRPRISADGEDLSMVTVQIVDERGRVVPTADADVSFELSGPGKMLGVGNGDPSSHEPDHASKRRAFNGLCMVIVQGTKDAGRLDLRARASGLGGTQATIACDAAAVRPTLL